MKALGIAAVAVVVSGVVSGCATTAVPTGMKAGQFVQFACEGGKRFQARASDDGKTVRVRYEGGWELDRKSDGVFEADGWKLVTMGPDAAELLHNNKSIGKRCKAEA
jgi:hypothetical protein